VCVCVCVCVCVSCVCVCVRAYALVHPPESLWEDPDKTDGFSQINSFSWEDNAFPFRLSRGFLRYTD